VSFKQAFPVVGGVLDSDPRALAHFEFLAYNDTSAGINRLALELPLLNPAGFSSVFFRM
jgi:hypothetical protein